MKNVISNAILNVQVLILRFKNIIRNKFFKNEGYSTLSENGSIILKHFVQVFKNV